MCETTVKTNTQQMHFSVGTLISLCLLNEIIQFVLYKSSQQDRHSTFSGSFASVVTKDATMRMQYD